MRVENRWVVFVGVVAGCVATESSAAQTSDASGSGVEIITDVVYGHKFGMALTFDVFRPERPNGAAVVFMNSAGYTSPFLRFLVQDGETHRLRTDDELGNRREFSPWPLLDNGFTVFDLRHGSAPKFLLPEGVDDARRAIRAIREMAPDFGVNPERLGLWGGSAGGHLSLLLGVASELAPDGVEAAGAPVAAIVAYFPASDMVTARWSAARWAREVAGRELLEVFPAVGYPEERDPEFSPINYVTADDPPTLIIHGDRDRMLPLEQGRMMVAALSEVGVEAELVVVEGSGHGFAGADVDLALTQMLTWFQRHLR